MANPPSLLSDQSQAAGDQGGIWGGITGLLGLFKPDYSAEYTGSLAKDPTTGQMDPAVQRAFAMRALAGASQAFAEGGMPVPYKGGIPLLSTIGKAGAAATLAPDSLIDAREKAAQTTLALANAGNAQAMALARNAFAQGYQQRPTGGQSGTGTDGKPLTGPAALLASGGGKVVSSTTADDTLPPQARALLDTISGPESSGAYNVRWGGPGGDKTFSDFSQHPNIPEPGPQGNSTAAGRYQIVNSTWKPLQAKYGFSDFSPATQDQAAWHLAADTYNEKTGRDLQADLQNGDTSRVASALHGQWSTLNMGSYDKNLEKYAQPTQTASAGPTPAPAPGKPPSLLDLPPVPNAAAQLAPTAPPNAPALPAPPPGSAPPPTPGPQSLLAQPPPNAPALSPAAQAIAAGMDNAQRPGAQFAGPGAAEAPGPNLVPGGAMTGPPPQVTQGPPPAPGGGLLANPPAAPPPPPAAPADAAAARAAAMGQEGGGVPGLLQQPPPVPPAGAAPAPVAPPPAVPATAAPQAAPAAPAAPALPPPPTIPPELNKHISDAEIQWAKKMSALAIAGGLTVPPDIAALSTLDVDMAKAEQQARLKAYYDLQTAGPIAAATAAGKLPYTPERVAPGAGISMGGQPPQWYAPEHVEMFNRATQRKEWATGTKQPDGTTKYEFSGIPTGPSAAETAAGTTAGPYTPAAVPGAPMRAAPGAPPIYPQNPNPAKNIPSPSGTVIPAPTNQVLPQNYSDYAKQQDLWNERRSDLVTAQTLSAGAETKIRMMIDAAKVNQMGAGTEGRAQLGNWLVTLGANQDWVNKNLTNVPAVQQFLYGQARETLGTLAAVNKRFTGGEFKITSQSGAGTEYLNEANLPVLADDLARVRQLQLVSQDFNHAQTVKYADGSYWNNPESFISQWYQANPLGKIKAQTMQQIGPLAGMTGVPGVPKEAVPTGRTSGGWPVYKMPNGQEGTFPGEWR